MGWELPYSINPTLVVKQTTGGGNSSNDIGLVFDVQGNGDGSSNALRIAGLGTSRFVVKNGGNIGIGTVSPANLLDVVSSSTSTASAMIRNTSTSAGIAGLGIQLSSTTLDTTSRFVNFLDKNGTIIGKIQAANTTSVNYATNGVDFAEWFTKEYDKLEPGDVW